MSVQLHTKSLKVQILNELAFKSNQTRETVEQICDSFIRKQIRSAYNEYLIVKLNKGEEQLSFDDFVRDLAQKDREKLSRLVNAGLREATSIVLTVRNCMDDEQLNSSGNLNESTRLQISGQFRPINVIAIFSTFIFNIILVILLINLHSILSTLSYSDIPSVIGSFLAIVILPIAFIWIYRSQ